MKKGRAHRQLRVKFEAIFTPDPEKETFGAESHKLNNYKMQLIVNTLNDVIEPLKESLKPYS
jgi:hypothetical protein